MAICSRYVRFFSRVRTLCSASNCASDPAVVALQQLDLTTFRPLPPSHGDLPTYARYSATLQHLLRLGVNLSVISRRSDVADFVARADFNSDVAPVVRFLGEEFDLTVQEVAQVLTRAPEVLLPGEVQRMARLKAYLGEVGFQRSDINLLVTGFSTVLLKTPEELDHLFELLQQTFALTGSELRQLVLTDPPVVDVPPNSVRVLSGVLTKSLGFNLRERHRCVVTEPRLLRTKLATFNQNFAILHTRHGLQHDLIAQNAEVLTARFRQLKERLQFLKTSGRAQFDPNKPLFTPPRILAAKTDEEFCAELPGVDIEQYNEFLRTL